MEDYRQLLRELQFTLDDISRLFAQELAMVENLPLNKRQFRILLHIIFRENVTTSEIAVHFGITKSAVSQALSVLEQHQFIIRSINEENRRENRLELGPQGELIKQKIEEAETVLIERYISKLPFQDIVHVKNVLEQFRDIILDFNQRGAKHK
ncbi:MarR family transcriptional regulator [Halalkalibacterium halodurans]|uniref:Transcriptional regulator n=1 Tax=Halalkalibacterium halodurans TaxID=86665 RepID=A0A0M0KFH9_ALKHA|nr:MarR family transcriptional regulator [Halalkalibacterium halodurans]MED3646471.1 MarR family transcriptional regulator [Halalkalibacterium halodurans]MED4161458.1 MarR family transcriptional regulator [Halalkalibacterium halodurans]TES57363.1 MarR family transcriptional regulator [Halalkalibacterium halodurans]TPE69513.1 MarR family transcriptional regulator [Halalkalibacterium halodurans]